VLEARSCQRDRALPARAHARIKRLFFNFQFNMSDIPPIIQLTGMLKTFVSEFVKNSTK